MRRAHYLRENRGAALPVMVIAFDTETDSIPAGPATVEARLRFGWAAAVRRHRGTRWTPPTWRRFTTPEELWAWVEDRVHFGTRVYLVAHNLGFDLRVSNGVAQLQARGWELKGAVIDDPPTIFRWAKGRRSIVAVDLMNYYRTSLRDVGRTVGLSKLDHDLHWTGAEEDDAYCRRDVEIVLAAFTGLVARVGELDLGNFAHTFPALAFGAWRHRHLAEPVLIDDNPKALDVARAGYYGGRTEAYRLGRIAEPVTVYDVNSLYPSVMVDTPMPTILRGVYTRAKVTDLADPDPAVSRMADVTLETESADYPVVSDGRLVFPVGHFRTVLAEPELRHAHELGRVRRVHRLVAYQAAVIFRSFVLEWYARRLEAQAKGDVAMADFCKRMMNSLYGKLGQRGEVWEPDGPTAPDLVASWVERDADTGVTLHRRAFGGLVSTLAREVESRESHPAIAATVTSEARMRLLGLLDALGRPHVIYVDTDSLFCLPSAPGAVLAALVGTELGKLKREKVLEGLTIYGLKDYAAEGLARTKGIRPTADELEPGVFAQDTFQGLKGAVRDGELHRQLIRRTVKRLARTYDKGTVGPDGTVYPLRFG